MPSRKSTANTVETPAPRARTAKGTFARGNPGKPKGSRNRATQAAISLMEGQANALTKKAIELALAGDSTALRLCIERIAPAPKDAPVKFKLPKLGGVKDVPEAQLAVLKAVASGELTPSQGASTSALIDRWRDAIETGELAVRIDRLEQATNTLAANSGHA